MDNDIQADIDLDRKEPAETASPAPADTAGAGASAPAPAPVPTPMPSPEAAPAPQPTQAPGARPFIYIAPKTKPMEAALLRREGEPSLLSAERAPAAVVLEEQARPMEATAPPIPERPEMPESAAQKQAALGIPALHTYKTDIERAVRGKTISAGDIAAASRRGTAPSEEKAPGTPAVSKRALEIGGGILLLAAAAGLIAWSLLSRTAPIAAPAAPASTFITTDETVPVAVAPDESRTELMQDLEAKSQGVTLALGLIARLYPEASAGAAGGAPAALSTQQLLALLAPNAPDELARALSPEYLLGVHSFGGNQPFLIFKTDTYSQAFAGMLAWETSMQDDLAPFFTRTPSPRIPEQGTTTPAVSPQLLGTPFVDRVIENHNARVIENSSGDILLLWTFINQETLVITTNEYTLREIISRLTTAPVIPVPGK